MAKTGILLLNIGSPRSYEVPEVKKYLSNFLMDEEVINLPFIFRWPLVNLLIVPKRGPISAGNYKKIWMEGQGSPLTVYTQHFADKLQRSLGSDFSVKVGMRYSDPSIPSALKEFATEGVQNLFLAPMFPQYADATTGSSLREVERQIKKLHLDFNVKSLRDFYQDASFIDPSVQITKDVLKDEKIDHYLFSFHGLPESHVRKMEGCLKSETCCFEKSACEKPCYRAQCFATATAIAKKLDLQPSHWSLSFQSRLGRAEWLKPSTEHSLEVLGKTGKKNIAVLCPSFVADCIETLEEIGIGGEETFRHNGGEKYHLIPCMNEDNRFVEGFANLIRTRI
ncbi:MAG: ferrochelatase [Bacillota bacterium]